MNNLLKGIANKIGKLPGVSDVAIERMQEAIKLRLPNQYLEFMKLSNGASGWIGENSLLQLWPIEQLAEHNEGYAVEEFAPGMFLFGSDGCGKAYAFDVREEPVKIIETHFEVLGWDEISATWNTFAEFLEHLANE